MITRILGHWDGNPATLIVTPDNGEKYLIELSNVTLINIEGIPGSATEKRQVPPGRPLALPDPVNILVE